MAISATHYALLKSLKAELPYRGKLLEIGEANWYGDVPPLSLLDDCDNPKLKERVIEGLAKGSLFAVAKAFYITLFDPSVIHAVDLNGTESALRQDLNMPLQLETSYDVVINHGTAEHVFNIARVFLSMHQATVEGGLMIHESPFTGWVDHGFYCLQPTLFYDVAAANEYEIVGIWIEEIESQQIIPVESRDQIAALAKGGDIPNNSMLFVVYRKRGRKQFRIPIQGYYDGTLSEAGKEAWYSMR
jgi:hypothetical protein